jgi:poly-gamma-glutamate synthesis protein (capsule biosynthesis protein)
MDLISIIIGGDLGPTQSNFSFFSSGNIDKIVDQKLLDILASSDLRIFNLEIPLIANTTPIKKDGPVLSAPVSTIRGIKLLDPSVLAFANNHILDHGGEGLLSTIEQLSRHKIGYTGAGENIFEASRPFIIEKQGHRIGLYASAEHEFSIAGETNPGANPFDPLESLDHIARLKTECDYVIVLFHGGKERYRYPTPNLQKVCRKMISRGADLIVCQHSHCVGSKEDYKNGTIVYGQGNFLFDRHNDEFYQTGLLVNVKLDKEIEVDFIPIQKKGNGVGIPDTKLGQEILDGFRQRSEAIKDSDFVERQFDEYCSENGQYYLATFAGLGKTIRRIDKVLNRPLTRLIYSRKKLNTIQNHFECETHREILLRYIKILKGDKAR